MLDAFAGKSRPAGFRRGESSGVAQRRAELEELEAQRAGKAPTAGSVELPAQENRKRGAGCRTRDTQLENERRVMQNVQKLQESAGTAYDALYENPNPPWR
jgi:DNA repair ATPase RecN